MPSGSVMIHSLVVGKACEVLFFAFYLHKKPLYVAFYLCYNSIRTLTTERIIKMSEYLNFSEISQKVQFKQILDWLNIPYSLSDGVIKGDGFIIDIAKNLYFNPKGSDRGSVINFLAAVNKNDLRTAAQVLKHQFLDKLPQPDREIPNLNLLYTKEIEDLGFTPEFAANHEFGLVKQHSIMAGKIAFKIYNGAEHIGYVGFNPKNNDWFFPKGFKRVLYNNNLEAEKVVLTVSILETLDLLNKGVPSVSLIGKSMTEIQEEQLKVYKYIIVKHPEPDNIVIRLSRFSFVNISPN